MQIFSVLIMCFFIFDLASADPIEVPISVSVNTETVSHDVKCSQRSDQAN